MGKTVSKISENILAQEMAEAKVLTDKQEVFPAPHVSKLPTQIKYKKSIRTTNAHTCCWRSAKDDTILLGGENTVTVLRLDGKEKVYELWWHSLQVISGIAMTSEKQLICVQNKPQNIVFTVNIPDELPACTRLHHVNQLTVIDPVCVFIIDKLRYGVLCRTRRIDIFTLKNILLDLQHETSESIRLGINISTIDMACATPDGNICVTSFLEGGIYIYNIDGYLIDSYSRESKWTMDNDWHRLFWDGLQHRLFVQCCEDGILIVCDNGCIFTLRESGIIKLEAHNPAKYSRSIPIDCFVSSSGLMWIVNREQPSVVQAYTCCYLSKSIDGTHSKHSCKAIAIREPYIERCLGEVYHGKYSKTIVTKNKVNCSWPSDEYGKILLGGWNTITHLRDDGSETVFKLWDENMKLISGISVTSVDHLICVKDARKTKVFAVNIPYEMTNETQLELTNKLDVDNPSFIFALDKVRYGILSTGLTKLIQIFTLKNILLDRNPLCKQTVRLSRPISGQDTACATPDRNFCVTSCNTHAVYIYSDNGDLLRKYSLKNVMVGDGRLLFPDERYQRLFVQCCADGIAIANTNGIIFTLNQGHLRYINIPASTIEENTDGIDFTVSSDGSLWVIEGEKKVQNNKIHIYKFDTQGLSDGDQGERHTVSAIVSPNIEQCLSDVESVKYDKAIIRTHRSHSCWRSDEEDNIFLGGKGTISVLNVEGDDKVYMLWDENLTIISGLSLTRQKQLICVRDMHCKTVTYTVNITSEIPVGTQLHSGNRVKVDKPVWVFALSTLSYGILCSTGHIRFFSLRNILRDRNNKSSDVIALHKDICDMDMACATPTGNICVTSSRTGDVCIYHRNGLLLATRHIPEEWAHITGHRLFVQCCKTEIVVAGDHDFIRALTFFLREGFVWKHVYSDSHKSRPVLQLGDISCCVWSETKLWVVDSGRIVKIYRYLEKKSDIL